jgi:hypothetical protein
MRRPNRDDYAICECRQVQEEGVSMCGGCDEYAATMTEWIDRYDPYEAADRRMDEIKDEDVHRG